MQDNDIVGSSDFSNYSTKFCRLKSFTIENSFVVLAWLDVLRQWGDDKLIVADF